MKRVFVIVALIFTLNNVAHASVASAEEDRQEEAARVMAQEMGLSRDDINQLKTLVAESAPTGNLNRCSDFGFAMQQSMLEKNPSLSDKVSEAIKDFGTWGCAAKNGD